MLHIPIVHAHNISKQLPREFCIQSENKVHLHAWIHMPVFWPIKLSMLKCSRGNINPFTTLKPSGRKCYKTIVSYFSCVFIEIWSTWEVWRALKKLELLLAMPQATLTHLSCSPNFLHASYLHEHTLTYEPIVNWQVQFQIFFYMFSTHFQLLWKID